MGIIVPLKFQTFCPIISHLIVTAPSPPHSPLSPRSPLSSHHRLTWQLAAWLFHNGDGEGKGIGRERKGSCVVIRGDIIIEPPRRCWGRVVRGQMRCGNSEIHSSIRKPNQVCNSQMIHQPTEILLPVRRALHVLQLHSYRTDIGGKITKPSSKMEMDFGKIQPSGEGCLLHTTWLRERERLSLKMGRFSSRHVNS